MLCHCFVSQTTCCVCVCVFLARLEKPLFVQRWADIRLMSCMKASQDIRCCVCVCNMYILYIYIWLTSVINIPGSFLGPKTAPRGSASVSASVRRGCRKIVFSCICSSCCADASA